MNDKYLYIGYKKIADITNREFKIETKKSSTSSKKT